MTDEFMLQALVLFYLLLENAQLMVFSMVFVERFVYADHWSDWSSVNVPMMAFDPGLALYKAQEPAPFQARRLDTQSVAEDLAALLEAQRANLWEGVANNENRWEEDP